MERVKNNPLMKYFDKWFDKTYYIKKSSKKLNNPTNQRKSDPTQIKKQTRNQFKEIPINDPNPVFDEFSIQQDDIEIDENKLLKKKYKKALHILRKVIRSFNKRNSIKSILQCKDYFDKWKNICFNDKNKSDSIKIKNKNLNNSDKKNKMKVKKLINVLKIYENHNIKERIKIYLNLWLNLTKLDAKKPLKLVNKNNNRNSIKNKKYKLLSNIIENKTKKDIFILNNLQKDLINKWRNLTINNNLNSEKNLKENEENKNDSKDDSENKKSSKKEKSHSRKRNKSNKSNEFNQITSHAHAPPQIIAGGLPQPNQKMSSKKNNIKFNEIFNGYYSSDEESKEISDNDESDLDKNDNSDSDNNNDSSEKKNNVIQLHVIKNPISPLITKTKNTMTIKPEIQITNTTKEKIEPPQQVLTFNQNKNLPIKIKINPPTQIIQKNIIEKEKILPPSQIIKKNIIEKEKIQPPPQIIQKNIIEIEKIQPPQQIIKKNIIEKEKIQPPPQIIKKNIIEKEKILPPKQIINNKSLPVSYLKKRYSNHQKRTREITYTEYNISNDQEPQTRIIKRIYYNNNGNSSEEMIYSPVMRNNNRLERNISQNNYLVKRDILLQKKLYYLIHKINYMKIKLHFLSKWKQISTNKKEENTQKGIENSISSDSNNNFDNNSKKSPNIVVKKMIKKNIFDINKKQDVIDSVSDEEYSNSNSKLIGVIKKKNTNESCTRKNRFIEMDKISDSENEEEDEEEEDESDDNEELYETYLVNNKIVNKTINLIKNKKYSNEYNNFYLGLLKKNNKINSAFHIFYVYGLFNDKNNLRMYFRKWKNNIGLVRENKINNKHIKNQKGHCIRCECDKLTGNNCFKCECKLVMKKIKKIVDKYKFLKEINPKKYYYNLWYKNVHN